MGNHTSGGATQHAPPTNSVSPHHYVDSATNHNYHTQHHKRYASSSSAHHDDDPMDCTSGKSFQNTIPHSTSIHHSHPHQISPHLVATSTPPAAPMHPNAAAATDQMSTSSTSSTSTTSKKRKASSSTQRQKTASPRRKQFTLTDAIEFIYSHAIPYSISVPEFCDIRIEEPFVSLNANHQLEDFKDSQITIQTVSHAAPDCIQLALGEWPHAHWEKIQIPNIRTEDDEHEFSVHREVSYDASQIFSNKRKLRSRRSGTKKKRASAGSHISSNNKSTDVTSVVTPFVLPLDDEENTPKMFHACRTMHTVQALKIKIISTEDGSVLSTRYVLNPQHEFNPFDSTAASNAQQNSTASPSEQQVGSSNAATDPRAHKFSQIRVEKTVTWVRLTIYVIDAGDGLFYWITGIMASESPRQVTAKSRNPFPLFSNRATQQIPIFENQVSVYDSNLLDPIEHVIFSRAYEFPTWQECRWSLPYRIPNFSMEMLTPPLWRVIDQFYIVSPIQLFSQNQIQEHFFFSMQEESIHFTSDLFSFANFQQHVREQQEEMDEEALKEQEQEESTHTEDDDESLESSSDEAFYVDDTPSMGSTPNHKTPTSSLSFSSSSLFTSTRKLDNATLQCCASIVQKNIQSMNGARVRVLCSFQQISVGGREALYSIFQTAAPPNAPYPYIEKIVVNVKAAEPRKQWIFSYISSCGFRSENLWKEFLNHIRIGSLSDELTVENKSNNSQQGRGGPWRR